MKRSASAREREKCGVLGSCRTRMQGATYIQPFYDSGLNIHLKASHFIYKIYAKMIYRRSPFIDCSKMRHVKIFFLKPLKFDVLCEPWMLEREGRGS